MTNTIAWPAGQPLVRAHPHVFGSTEFDGRDEADCRFSPLHIDGRVVPVLYAGSDDTTAAAETVFRALPNGRRPRRVLLDRYRAWHWAKIAPQRRLALLPVDQTLEGASALVDGDAASYPASREGAATLLGAHSDVDGLVWASRQLHEQPSSERVDSAETRVCVLLVARTAGRAGGVSRGELKAVGPVVPFATAAGAERLDAIAVDLDITVVRS